MGVRHCARPPSGRHSWYDSYPLSLRSKLPRRAAEGEHIEEATLRCAQWITPALRTRRSPANHGGNAWARRVRGRNGNARANVVSSLATVKFAPSTSDGDRLLPHSRAQRNPDPWKVEPLRSGTLKAQDTRSASVLSSHRQQLARGSAHRRRMWARGAAAPSSADCGKSTLAASPSTFSGLAGTRITSGPDRSRVDGTR